MIATSNEEKDMWVDAINTNINTYSVSWKPLSLSLSHTHTHTHAHIKTFNLCICTHPLSLPCTHTQHSAEALTTACKELRGMLHAVNSGVLPKDIPPLLLLLHTRMKNIISEQQEVCHSLHTH